MLLGSEGILGVITEAWVRVQEAPRFKESAAVLFDGFEQGAQAVRALAQSRLYPSNCRLLDPGEASLTERRAGREGAAGARVRGGERPGRRLDGAGARAVPRPRRRAARAPRRVGGRLARRVPARALPARRADRGRRARRDLRDRDHLGPLRAVRGAGARADGRGARPRGAPDLPHHPRLPGRRGALLHRAGAGPARVGARAVGRGQGGRLRRDRGRRRHDHPPPRGRPRPPALVRPPAPRARSPQALRAAKAAVDPKGMLNPGVLVDP